LLPALDASNNLVYVPSYAWWYLDSDGSIVLDWKRFAKWVEKTGYVVVPEPFETCDEESCYRNWVDCNKFILYPNFDIAEFNEGVPYLKVRRRSDGTAFKVVGLVAVYLLLELEHGMSLCEAILLYTALKAKLRVLSEDEALRHRHREAGGCACRRANNTANGNRPCTRPHRSRLQFINTVEYCGGGQL
jgi:hypothetical protein